MIPVNMEEFQRIWRGSASTDAHSLISIAGTPSGPQEVLLGSLLIDLRMSSMDKYMTHRECDQCSLFC